MESSLHADIGVFGGSGFYTLIEDATRSLDRDAVRGTQRSNRDRRNRRTARRISAASRQRPSLPAASHQLPREPVRDEVARRASWLIGPTAGGSLEEAVAPGSMVVCDQLVDRTRARADTFYDGPLTTHVSFADPYCPTLRPIAVGCPALARQSRPTRRGRSWSSKARGFRRAPNRSGSRARAGKSST